MYILIESMRDHRRFFKHFKKQQSQIQNAFQAVSNHDEDVLYKYKSDKNIKWARCSLTTTEGRQAQCSMTQTWKGMTLV